MTFCAPRSICAWSNRTRISSQAASMSGKRPAVDGESSDRIVGRAARSARKRKTIGPTIPSDEDQDPRPEMIQEERRQVGVEEVGGGVTPRHHDQEEQRQEDHRDDRGTNARTSAAGNNPRARRTPRPTIAATQVQAFQKRKFTMRLGSSKPASFPGGDREHEAGQGEQGRDRDQDTHRQQDRRAGQRPQRLALDRLVVEELVGLLAAGEDAVVDPLGPFPQVRRAVRVASPEAQRDAQVEGFEGVGAGQRLGLLRLLVETVGAEPFLRRGPIPGCAAATPARACRRN